VLAYDLLNLGRYSTKQSVRTCGYSIQTNLVSATCVSTFMFTTNVLEGDPD